MVVGRWVLHVDMDAFFASVEQLTRPTLRGRPVLVGGAGPRGVVAGASYEARRFGARSAMPTHQARRLVGAAAVVLPPRGAVYGAASRRVFAVLRQFDPVIEQLSFDEAFLEPAVLVGADEGQVLRFCAQLRARVLEVTGLVASVGAGPGKQVAKIASGQAKPDGVRIIAPDVQGEVLAALPVGRLWGVGPVAQDKLRKVGVVTVGQFAQLSPVEVASLLGSTVGAQLHALARGVDDRPVAERAEAKQVSAETTFERDLLTAAEVRAAVAAAGEHAHARLLRDGRAARTVTVKLRKADFSTVTRSVTLPYATTDRQVLLAAARKVALDPVQIGPVRLVGVGLAGLSAEQQTVLFTDLDQCGSPPEPVPGDQAASAGPPPRGFWQGADVRHPEFGHGWVQGVGHGVVTVRFETRASGPGRARTFPADAAGLRHADPVDSLDWPPEGLGGGGQ